MSDPIYIKAQDSFIQVIIKCISDAVGDDIKHDVKSHRLVTQNSTPSRVWDFINTNICERFALTDVIAHPTKRGPWELVPAFERETGIIYSLMREERFITLKKELPKRRNAHYVDAFVKSLNADLVAPHNQITLFPLQPCHFSNEDIIPDILDNILSDLGVPGVLVKRHALILFKSFNNELSSVRCCIVDSSLDIVEQANWSNSINAHESVITDDIVNKTSAYNDPTMGLQFKQKAKDKIDQKFPSLKDVDVKESDDIG